MSDGLDLFLKRMEPLFEKLEAQPNRPFSQTEIDELRETLATLKRIVSFLTTLGWFGKCMLWLLGIVVLVLSQLDALRVRLGW